MLVKRNLIFSFISTASRLISAFFLLFVLARFLTVSQFGIVAFSLVVANLLGLVTEYGFSLLISKETGKDVQKTHWYVSGSLQVKTIISLLLLLFLWILFESGALKPDYRAPIFIFFLSNIFNAWMNSFLVPFRSVNRFDVEALFMALVNIGIFLACVGLIVFGGFDIMAAPIAFLFVRLLVLPLVVLRFKKQFGLQIVKVPIAALLSRAFPYAGHMFIGSLFLNVDTIILERFVSQYDIGIYQAGIRLVVAAGLLLDVLANVLVPKFARRLKDGDNLDEIRRYNIGIIGFALVLAVALYLFSNVIIQLLYGSNFQPLVAYMPWFVGIIFIRYIGVLYGILLTLSENQRIRFIGLIISLAFIVLVDLIVIPVYGIIGALWVLLAGHLLLLSMYVLFARREYGTLFLRGRKSSV